MAEYSTIWIPFLGALLGGVLVVFARRRPTALRRQGLLVVIAVAVSLAAAALAKEYFGLSVVMAAVVGGLLSGMLVATGLLLAKRLATSSNA